VHTQAKINNHTSSSSHVDLSQCAVNGEELDESALDALFEPEQGGAEDQWEGFEELMFAGLHAQEPIPQSPTPPPALPASDSSLANIMATVSSDLPFDLLNPPQSTAPRFAPAQHALGLIQDYARAARLLQLAQRWYPKRSRESRRDFFHEVDIIQTIVGQNKWHPWAPLKTWFNAFDIDTPDLSHSKLDLFSINRKLSTLLQARATRLMDEYKQQLVDLRVG
jgi:hypothetical protein